MTRPDRSNLLRYTLEPLGRRDAATPECLDDETIAALAEGAMPADERAAAVSHLASCQRCRGAVASVASAIADPSVAKETAAIDRAGWRWLTRVAQVGVPLAAAAILLVVVWPERADDGVPTHRAPTLTATPPPAPMWPVGAVSQARDLRWEAVSGADRYRVTLFDATGDVLYETQLSETVVRLPDSVMLVRGQPYLWKVEARTGFDRWAASDLIEFSIAGEPPR